MLNKMTVLPTLPFPPLVYIPFFIPLFFLFEQHWLWVYYILDTVLKSVDWETEVCFQKKSITAGETGIYRITRCECELEACPRCLGWGREKGTCDSEWRVEGIADEKSVLEGSLDLPFESWACAFCVGILGSERHIIGTARSFLGLGVCLGTGWWGVSK